MVQILIISIYSYMKSPPKALIFVSVTTVLSSYFIWMSDFYGYQLIFMYKFNWVLLLAYVWEKVGVVKSLV